MAVVYRFPDRISAGPRPNERIAALGRSAEIVILPCIRRETLGIAPSVHAVAMPAQLQA